MSANAAYSEQPAVSQESLLHSYLVQLERDIQGRRAVHLHLSKLHSQGRHDNHLRIACNTFEGPVQQFDGQLFPLSNGDLVYVCRGVSAERMDEAVTRVHHLFSDDPIALSELGDKFCS